MLLARWQRKALERIRHRLPELRQDYLNTIACKAGTNQNEWYSDENILLREALREHPRVQEAIAHAWNACSQGKQRIDRLNYFAMTRRLYLAVLYAESRGSGKSFQPDPADAMATAEKDFNTDSGGKEHLTRADFERCLFELADLYTVDDPETATLSGSAAVSQNGSSRRSGRSRGASTATTHLAASLPVTVDARSLVRSRPCPCPAVASGRRARPRQCRSAWVSARGPPPRLRPPGRRWCGRIAGGARPRRARRARHPSQAMAGATTCR